MSAARLRFGPLRQAAAFALALLGSGTVLAQQSASFRLEEHVFNAGGRPSGGLVAASASHRITLDAVGDSISPGHLSGGAHQLGGGFVSVYPPPGEVAGLRFADDVTLIWSPEPSTGRYNVYRGLLNGLPALTYGGCRQSEIAGTTTTDPDNAPSGQGFFYLVTAENLIAEEGTKGFASSGNERSNGSPCP